MVKHDERPGKVLSIRDAGIWGSQATGDLHRENDESIKEQGKVHHGLCFGGGSSGSMDCINYISI